MIYTTMVSIIYEAITMGCIHYSEGGGGRCRGIKYGAEVCDVLWQTTHVSARLSGRGYTARFQPSAGKKTDG